MYLCDQMNGMVRALPEDDFYVQRSEFVKWMRKKMVDVLENAELIIMEKSALTAAGSLKFGDPDRTEKMLKHVLDEPGRYFIECSHSQRDEEMGRLMASKGKDTLPEGRYNPQRVGLDIKILRPGVAEIQPYWCFPKAAQEAIPVTEPGGRLRREALKYFSAMGIGHGKIVVNVADIEPISFADFKEKYKDGLSPLLKEAADNVLMGQKFTERQYLDAAWREERMNSYSRFEFDRSGMNAAIEACGPMGMGAEEILHNAQRDLDGELLFAVGMLAVLRARRDTDAIKVQERPKRARKMVKRPKLEDLGLPRLSLFSLERDVKSRVKAEGDGSAAGRGLGSKRIRHLVGTHLFLARNGKIVWRKEHYRGSFEAVRARRVR